MTEKKLTKAQEERIKHRAEEIITLETFVEQIRQNPTMYIGELSNGGYYTIFKEVFQNSVDQMTMKDSICDRIEVWFDERTKFASVEDNGMGLPHGHIIRICTDPHTSSNYNKKEGEFSAGVFGIGLKCTNGVSVEFSVESYVLGKGKKVDFINMIPTTETEIDIPNPNNKQGTKISFIPCLDVLGEVTVTVNDMLMYIKNLVPLIPLGKKVIFNGVYKDGTEYREEIINEDGILTYLILMTQTPLTSPIYINANNGESKAEIVFTYDSQILSDPKIVSFSNFCPTAQGGTHVDGFVEGVCRFFRDYMNKIYLKNNKKLSVINNDIKTGLLAVVNVSALRVFFSSQGKERLTNKEMFPFVRDTVIRQLNQWSKTNSNDLQKICKFLKGIAEIRVKSEEGKTELSRTYDANPLSGLPAKYSKPTKLKKGFEFIIVEGDSAGGHAKKFRDNASQGILPIKGKIPNAFTTKRSEFLNNDEVNAIITVSGCGIEKKCNPDLSPVDKVVFMPDADPDGAHIRALLLRLYMRYMIRMIEAGKVYAAVPPLYSIPKGKKDKRYFIDNWDFIEYVQQLFSKNNQVFTTRGNKLSNKEIISIIYNNDNYIYDMDILSNRYAIDPYLLELLIFNKDKSFNQLQSILKKQFRFVEFETVNNTNIIKGLVNNKYQTVFLTDRFFADINPIIDQYSNQTLYYNINNNVTSLYDFMQKFKATTPNGLVYYKGQLRPRQGVILGCNHVNCWKRLKLNLLQRNL